MRDTIDPVKSFNHLIQNWWKLVLFAIIGGLLGLAVSYIKPAKYQAEALFHASIDFTEVNFENLVNETGDPVRFTQYDEDIALQVVQRMLLAKLNDAFRYARTLDPELDGPTFQRDKQIQRLHAQWALRYRHENPQIAQAIVNYWADIGLEALREAQASGRAEPFVIVDLVYEADLPQSPIYHHRNTLLLSGTVIGLLCGIIWVDFGNRFLNRRAKGT